MKRALAVLVAALGLIGWADPKTATPTVSKDAAADEARREEVYVIKSRADEARRVVDIAYRLEAANQELCADRRASIGLSYSNLYDFDERSRAAAAEALGLGEAPSVLQTVAGPAAAAGVQPADVLVSVNGEPVPTGRGAVDKLSRRLDEILAKAPAAPVVLVVRRGEALQSFGVTPIQVCAYGVFVEEGKDVNAFADGRAIHIERPILRIAATDDELALVIAHELAHNGQHHIQAQMHNARILGLGGLLLDAAAAAEGVNTKGAFTKAGMGIGAAHANVEFEAEADYVGMYYLARAGYPIEGVENFWRKMAVEFPDAIFVKTDHPTSPARFLAIAAAAKEIEAKRANGEPLVPNQQAKN